jgi:hypothetical protein
LLRFARRNNGALANNHPHQFALNYAMSIYRAAAVYSFIPKNACSTLRFSVALANGCIGDADVNWVHENNQTFKPSVRELATADYAFVVLRDPFRRAPVVSSTRSSISGLKHGASRPLPIMPSIWISSPFGPLSIGCRACCA